jgi:putative DNA primase/helicase
MISLAESELELAMKPDQLDTSPMLLNCMNGTIDLMSGQLRPHCRNDFITRIVPVEYDPDALCPLWDQTLEEIFPEKPELLISFSKRSAIP